MSATLATSFTWSVTVDSKTYGFTVTKNLTINGQVYESGTVEVATSSTKTLIDMNDTSFSDLMTPAGGSAAFDFLLIHNVSAEDAADKVYIEITTDVNAGVGDELITFELPTGAYFALFSNHSYANYTANFAGGTIDAVERVRVRNLSSTTVAKLRIAAAN